MSGAERLLPPYAFVLWTGTKLFDYNYPRTSRKSSIHMKSSTSFGDELPSSGRHQYEGIYNLYITDISILKYHAKNK